VSKLCRIFPFSVLLAGLAASTAAHSETSMTDLMTDPYVWLEAIESPEALDWVREHNAITEAELAATPEFKALEAELLAIYDSTDRIPGVYKQGTWYYNFWRDEQHERGIWRRTTLDEYRKPVPVWETILDLDALNAAEHTNWVWGGANCLRPTTPDAPYTRCLINLSRGGADATVTREFDLVRKTFVQDGFQRSEAKGGMDWIDQDTVYVYTDFGPGSMTESGYPRIAKRWTRGTPLSEAQEIYAGKPDDMYIAAGHDDTPGFERDYVTRTLAFYNDELYLRTPAGVLTKVEAPNSANKGFYRRWLTLELREPWTVGAKTYPAGALLVADIERFVAGERDFDLLFEPTATTSLAGVSFTQNHLLLNIMDDVKNRLWVLTPGEALAGVPELGTLSARAVDADESDAIWLTVTDYLTPTTLLLGNAAENAGDAEVLKTQPAFFDASTHVVEQHFATSDDGTRVPYFLVRPKDLHTNAIIWLWWFRDFIDAELFRRHRQGLAGTWRGVCGGQYPRWRRIRPRLAPGRTQGQSA